MTALSVRTETWPIRGSFTIARGSKTTAEVVVAELNRLFQLAELLECGPVSGLRDSRSDELSEREKEDSDHEPCR